MKIPSMHNVLIAMTNDLPSLIPELWAMFCIQVHNVIKSWQMPKKV